MASQQDVLRCAALRLEERACEMKRLWVKGEFRGLRLGRRLAEEAIGWAKRMGFAAMYLDTVPAAMPEANRLYEELGFVPVERYNSNPVAGIVFFRLGFNQRLSESKRRNTGILHLFRMTTEKVRQDDDAKDSPGFTQRVIIGSVMLGVVPTGSGVQVELQGFGVTDSG